MFFKKEIKNSKIVSKEDANDILSSLFSELSPKYFLVYGSIAKDLLSQGDVQSFGDIDLVVAQPLDNAAEALKNALDNAKIPYKNDTYKTGEFVLFYKDKEIPLQLIDKEEAKLAYPRGFIEFNQYQFTEYDYVNKIPCVPLKYFATPGGRGFYHKNDPKRIQTESTQTISNFNF